MKTRKMVAIRVAGAAMALIVVWLQVGAVSGAPMGQGPGPSVVPWLIHRMLTFPGAAESLTELIGVNPDDLSMGTPWRLHDMSGAMYAREVTENLQAEILPSDANDYIVPIMYNGATVAALSVEPTPESPTGWDVISVRGGEAAHALDDLQPADRILLLPVRKWFAIRGDLVIPLGPSARSLVAEPVTLSEFQGIVYEDMSCPEGMICGSGGGSGSGGEAENAGMRSPGWSQWVPVAGIATCAGGSLWLVRRRRARASGGPSPEMP